MSCPVISSRWLKIRCRQELTGDILLLDTDTVTRRCLDPIFSFKHQTAAAPNHGTEHLATQLPVDVHEKITRLHRNYSPTTYYNTGVVFLADSPANRDFSQEWYREWLSWRRIARTHHDQPAFNIAVSRRRIAIGTLPHEYNAQFTYSPQSFHNAAVWHYYLSIETSWPTTLFEKLARNTCTRSEENVLSTARILLNQPHPWLKHHWLSRTVVHRAGRRGNFREWELALAQGLLGRHLGRRLLRHKNLLGSLATRTSFLNKTSPRL